MTFSIYIATSLDGDIAAADSRLGWLNSGRKNTHLNGSGTVGGAGPNANRGIMWRPHYDILSGVIPKG
jgi:hypothetical protein